MNEPHVRASRLVFTLGVGLWCTAISVVAGCATAGKEGEVVQVDARLVDAVSQVDATTADRLVDGTVIVDGSADSSVDARIVDGGADSSVDARIVDGSADSSVDARIVDGSVVDSGIDGGSCAPPIAGGSCDVSPVCGCAASQNCQFVFQSSAWTTQCGTAGTKVNYAACTVDSECARGSACIEGACEPYCKSDADCPGSYRKCLQITNGAGTPISGLKVCTQFCNPLSPQGSTGGYSACGAGLNCVPFASGGITSCLGPTDPTGTQGSFCDAVGTSGGDISQCAPGFVCVGDPFGFTFDCYKWCRVGMSSTDCSGSAAGLFCQAFSTPQYAGTSQIGYCTD